LGQLLNLKWSAPPSFDSILADPKMVKAYSISSPEELLLLPPKEIINNDAP